MVVVLSKINGDEDLIFIDFDNCFLLLNVAIYSTMQKTKITWSVFLMVFCKTRKIVALIVCLFLVAAVFAGCADAYVPELTGTTTAKLLLANHRLNSNQLEGENLFDNGAKTLQTLARRAARNLNVGVPCETIGNFSTANGQAEWSGFVEYNNSFSYFQNVTEVIVGIAQKGAFFIDDVKENVKIVDVWVNYDNAKYYLSVGENYETLCRVDADEVFTCKRYTNENGKTVYELFSEQDFSSHRVKYVPDERYELTELIPSVDQELYFVADHSKGYWETFCATDTGEFYNERFTVMKNDVSYVVDYDAKENFVGQTGIMSADSATEFFRIGNSGDDGLLSMELQFAGFDGISKVVAPSADVDENGNLTSSENAVVHLKNGQTIKTDSAFVGGNVQISAINVASLSDGYVGSLGLNVSGETREDAWKNFEQFLAETGLVCRRNWTTVFNGIPVAQEDAANLVKYYRWNDCCISTAEGVQAGVAAENERIAEIKQIHQDVKNNAVVNFDDLQENVDLDAIDFANIGGYAFENAKIFGNEVSIESVELSVNDVQLFVSGTSYVIALALISDNGNDVVVLAKSALVEYDGADTFAISAQRLQCNLPDLAAGNYVLAAYVATADGIRVTACQGVEVSVEPLSVANVSVLHNDDKTIRLTYFDTTEHNVRIESSTSLSYDEFVEKVCEEVFVFGTPAAQPEKLADDGGYSVVESTDAILGGFYRMAYTVANGENTVTGYVYVEYVVG